MRQKVSRRRFLKGIGGATAAASFPDVLRVVAAQPTQESATRPRAIVFWEDNFPQIDGCSIDRNVLREALERFDVSYLSERELIEQLKLDRCDLLITPYGSAFPKRGWPALLKYLRAGGNLLNLGGVPFAVPVMRAGSQWRTENRQTAYHKKLGITQSFPVEAATIASYRAANYFAQDTPKNVDAPDLANQFKAEQVYELYVRFSSSSLIPEESGSDGPREAALYPLVFGMSREQRSIAAPMIQIDRLQGEFAGGRWVLANFSGRVNAAAVRLLAEQAAQGAFEFRVRSDFACYRAGETPQFTIDLRRPRGNLEKLIREGCRIQVRDGRGQMISEVAVPLKSESSHATATGKLKDATKLTPGLYRIDARLAVNGSSTHELTYTIAFWIYDQNLLTSGQPLTTDRNCFYRNGEVFPVTGTTYMASDVHRQFLFEPNPFVWDQDFRAMKAAGVNLVRTGIWTGWKKFMPEAGKINEAALRALDAFLLTAHQYDIPVIFTLFAFLPETWGAKNAYLDPQALRAQSQFASAFAQRYRDVDDLIWDLINEPSFCSPQHLWSCRPNYDEHEKIAWQHWLKERYPYTDEEAMAAALQQLWRTTSESTLDLPRLEDFDSPNILDDRRPFKTLDYRLFAQDMFARWVRAMTAAIKNNGNQKQLITVGQDEGGLGDSPNPHFFADTVDFTCMHNWWANDDLVWDSVMAKAPGKASLIEETGIMFYEQLDGSAWRTEAGARNLLERKLAISFAAQGAGFVQWIWNANCYMNSDNEAAIGFYRADQTAKPELDSFLKITKFIATHRDALRGREDEAVLMLIPHSQMFSPRSVATEATRKCVRAMFYHCRVPLRTVSEYKLVEDVTAKVIIVPAPRLLTEKCWQALVAHADRGATIVISGVLDADEYGVSDASRYQKIFRRPADTTPVSESEPILIGEREYLARYDGEKIQRIEKAVAKVLPPVQVIVQQRGAGRFVWSPLPLEAGNSMDPLVAFYRFALAQANVLPAFTVSPDTPSLLVLPSIFEQHVLYTLVSETDRDSSVTLTHGASRTRISVRVPGGRITLVLLDRLTGKLIDSTM
jgi:Cellulase (glycosyl hydrolase family 5)